MTVDLPKTLFQAGSPEAAMLPFLGFSAVAVVVVTATIIMGRPDLALLAAWSAIIVEVILALTRKVRLKVPLGLCLTLYGALVILAVAGVRAIH